MKYIQWLETSWRRGISHATHNTGNMSKGNCAVLSKSILADVRSNPTDLQTYYISDYNRKTMPIYSLCQSIQLQSACLNRLNVASSQNSHV